MIEYDAKRWLSVLFRWRGSVLPALVPRVVAAFATGFGAELLYRQTGFRIPAVGHTLLGVALGLLLVFRTNASYDRFWEGRRMLGALTNRSRDLVRQVVTLLGSGDGPTLRARAEIGRLVVLFCRLVAQSLRSERDLSSLGELAPPAERERLHAVEARPAVVAAWISARITAEAERSGTPELRLLAMDANVTALVDAWGSCQRIRSTPVPLAYAQHIKVFLVLWCYSVPFALVDTLHLYTPFASALLAVALFGIDEIGTEIEDPFGYDPNDLPIDRIVEGIAETTAEILAHGAPTRS